MNINLKYMKIIPISLFFIIILLQNKFPIIFLIIEIIIYNNY